MTHDPSSAPDGYKVGYGRPPRHSQFRPGQSGNKKGRPRGSKNFKTDVLDVLGSKIRITQDGKTRQLTTQQAMLERLKQKALRGDMRAINKLSELAAIYHDTPAEIKDTPTLAQSDADILEHFIKTHIIPNHLTSDFLTQTQPDIQNPYCQNMDQNETTSGRQNLSELNLEDQPSTDQSTDHDITEPAAPDNQTRP